MHPKISVIIPTFNRQALLKRAIDSVCIQQGPELEILVIDDGSTDETKKMVARLFPDVRYFYQKNQGVSAARNLGIRQAKAQWIAFLDSDDEWLPGKLEAQLDFFAEHSNYRICQTEEVWIRNGKRVNPMNKHKKYGGWIFEKCLPLCLISPSAVMMHRELLDSIGVFDESYPACEDYELWLRITCAYPVGLVHEALIKKYGGHEDQLSHRYEAMDFFRIRALVKTLSSRALNQDQEYAAVQMLREKSKIFLTGAAKRGQSENAALVETWIRPWITAEELIA